MSLASQYEYALAMQRRAMGGLGGIGAFSGYDIPQPQKQLTEEPNKKLLLLEGEE